MPPEGATTGDYGGTGVLGRDGVGIGTTRALEPTQWPEKQPNAWGLYEMHRKRVRVGGRTGTPPRTTA